MVKTSNIVVIGAGPYGLAAAAHLQAIPGAEVRVFGEPMEFWQKNMPVGMCLRSPWEASHIAHPKDELTLGAYTEAKKFSMPTPIPLERFVDYGKWFQEKGVKNLDRRKVRAVKPDAGGFSLELVDGEVVKAKRVVVAAGIEPFAIRPQEFAHLSRSQVSHAVDHADLRPFAKKRVLIVGGGQSALESAALLREVDAEVNMAIRQPRVLWLKWRHKLYRTGLLGKLLYSERDVGPPGISQLVARPDLFVKLPRGLQDKIGKRSIRPAGASWLMDRVGGVKFHTSRTVKAACPENGHLDVVLDDGSHIKCDHILLATGYRVDVTKYPFVSPELAGQIERFGGFPKLRPGLEANVPGLHFVGAPAAWSFGPVARFVSGAYYCVRALAHHIARSS
jgi:thioredoxin reductase